MSTLSELISEAQSQLSTYRHPETREVSKRLGEILMVLGRGSLEYDHIDCIEESEGNLVINTTYSMRGCSQSGEYEIPMEIINAEDPVQAVHLWLKQQALNETQTELARARAELKGLPEYTLRLKARVKQLAAEAAAQRQALQ